MSEDAGRAAMAAAVVAWFAVLGYQGGWLGSLAVVGAAAAMAAWGVPVARR